MDSLTTHNTTVQTLPRHYSLDYCYYLQLRHPLHPHLITLLYLANLPSTAQSVITLFFYADSTLCAHHSNLQHLPSKWQCGLLRCRATVHQVGRLGSKWVEVARVARSGSKWIETGQAGQQSFSTGAQQLGSIVQAFRSQVTQSCEVVPNSPSCSLVFASSMPKLQVRFLVLGN
jgi:hypothetical protein